MFWNKYHCIDIATKQTVEKLRYYFIISHVWHVSTGNRCHINSEDKRHQRNTISHTGLTHFFLNKKVRRKEIYPKKSFLEKCRLSFGRSPTEAQ